MSIFEIIVAVVIVVLIASLFIKTIGKIIKVIFSIIALALIVYLAMSLFKNIDFGGLVSHLC